MNEASGSDNINARIPCECRDTRTVPLEKMCTMPGQHVFPELWKRADAVPIFID